ncbi:MAG: FAD-dependent oxidoreductase [Oscillospiraceae bacterium]|nr:FAD-dependent oxidoreductase [Oscillospiraceae bacterium]
MNRIGIIGGGTAGMTAAIYAVRGGCQATVFEQAMFGGQIVNTASIENYPGLYQVSGADYAMKLYEQCVALGVEFLFSGVTAARLEDREKILESGGKEHAFDAVIIANGAQYRKLGCPGEERLTGHGVSYCATCDGAFYRGKTACVVGGGNTALEDALFLSATCKEVYLIHRRQEFRAHQATVEALRKRENVHFILDSVVEEILGEDHMESLVVKNTVTGEAVNLEAQGVFVAIGVSPDNGLFSGQLELDGSGYLKAGEDCCTNLPGVYAAGDTRSKPLRQLVTAAADGAAAAVSAAAYLQLRE